MLSGLFGRGASSGGEGLERLQRGIAPIHPVGFEIVVEVQDFHIGEAHRLQGIVSRLNVGAMGPRAAAAIEHDVAVLREGSDPFFERLKALGLGPGTLVVRSRYVGLIVQIAESYLDYEGLPIFVESESLNQISGLEI